MPRMKGTKKVPFRIEGLIVPRTGRKLAGLWGAFRTARTWERQGKPSRKTARYKHLGRAPGARVKLEWRGDAIRFVVEEGGQTGLAAGAFLGHVQRHGWSVVERMHVQFG